MRARVDLSSRLGSDRSEWPTPQVPIIINNLYSYLRGPHASFRQSKIVADSTFDL